MFTFEPYVRDTDLVPVTCVCAILTYSFATLHLKILLKKTYNLHRVQLQLNTFFHIYTSMHGFEIQMGQTEAQTEKLKDLSVCVPWGEGLPVEVGGQRK